MKHQHHAGKHRQKKHLIGHDQLRREERMTSLKSPSENNNMVVKQNGEGTSETTKEINTTNKDPIPVVIAENPLLPEQMAMAKEAHQNAVEKLGTQCKRISEHLHQILKHLF